MSVFDLIPDDLFGNEYNYGDDRTLPNGEHFHLRKFYKPVYETPLESTLFKLYQGEGSDSEQSKKADVEVKDQIASLVTDNVIAPQIWDRTLASSPAAFTAMAEALKSAEPERLARFVLKLLVEIYDADSEGDDRSDFLKGLGKQFGLE